MTGKPLIIIFLYKFSVPGKPALQISVGRTSLFMVATDGTVQTMINIKARFTVYFVIFIDVLIFLSYQIEHTI